MDKKEWRSSESIAGDSGLEIHVVERILLEQETKKRVKSDTSSGITHWKWTAQGAARHQPTVWRNREGAGSKAIPIFGGPTEKRSRK